MSFFIQRIEKVEKALTLWQSGYRNPRWQAEKSKMDFLELSVWEQLRAVLRYKHWVAAGLELPQDYSFWYTA